MTETTPTVNIQRVLVALDPAWQNFAQLGTAINLAARLHAELVALLVEDSNLLRLAGLPFAREIDRVSAQARALDSATVTERLRAHTSQLQRTLSAVASAQNVPWSVKVVRGQLLAEALAATVEQDVLFLCAGSKAPTLPMTRTATPLRAARSKPVWVWYDASDAAQRALRTAGELSTGKELALLLPADTASVIELRHQATQILGLGRTIGYCEVITNPALNEWLPRLREYGCSLLVLHRANLATVPSGHDALEHFDYPIVLVG